jgi:glycosyltransferase involved in cell wall biosynthesis
VIGVSDHVLLRHQSFFPTSTERRVILPPLAPVEGVTQRPRGTPLATLGYLGALTSSKGVGLLLEAAASIARMGVVLRIAGDGPLRTDVEASDHVRYEGRVEGRGLASFLSSCDAGVVPSLWEEPGLTYVVCEWLAAGRPVLATRRGGLAEAGAWGGVSFFEESAPGLARAVDRLRAGEEWQRVVGAVPLVEDLTDVERWIGEHLSAYHAALESSHLPVAP